VGDINRAYYRTKQEEQLWLTEHDPIVNFAKLLIEQRVVNADELKSIEVEIKDEMVKAVEFALAASYPTPDKAEEDVYAV
jgi:pyruvate dehydrogenase E1 component alpha subunit